MKTVYNLIITDLELSYKNHSEIFNIGYFTTYEKALETAERYLKEIEGFNKYRCSYNIKEKQIYNYSNQILAEEVFVIVGWNVNDNFDEIDIVESDCFILYETALQKLDDMKRECNRTEWCIDKYKLDECSLKDGFIRV